MYTNTSVLGFDIPLCLYPSNSGWYCSLSSNGMYMLTALSLQTNHDCAADGCI